MKSILACVSCLLAFSLLSGCGSGTGNIAPMSGTVTIDGEPVAGIEVVFSPKPVPGNSNVGPYSFGTTDADGKYELVTRYGDKGAVIGMHVVSLNYPDVEEGAIEELYDELKDAKADREGVDEVVAEIESAKKILKGRARIPKGSGGEFEVPAGGNSSFDFVLTNKKKEAKDKAEE